MRRGFLLRCHLIDEEYTSGPFYGSRRMVVFMRRAGHVVNRKRVQRPMRGMGLAGNDAGTEHQQAAAAAKGFPYLLRGVAVTRPNHVWSTDITYIRLARGAYAADTSGLNLLPTMASAISAVNAYG